MQIQYKPWGFYYIICENKNFKIKYLHLNAGERISYQYHTKRSENWTIVEGSGILTLDDKILNVNEGDNIKINLNVKHRIENNGYDKLIIIEVQTGTYFGEDDIIRIDDDYNRI